MKKEYDFSKGKKGQFYRKDAKLQIPVYLNPANRKFVEAVARKKKTDVESVVNELIKQDQKIISAIS